MLGRTDGLITLVAADALWVGLTADSAVPTATGAFVCPPARAQVGHVLLGSHVAATVRASSGQWSVPEAEVRRAAGKLNAVRMDRQDLVRIGPFRGAPRWESHEGAPLPWRRRITEELQELSDPERAVRHEACRPYLLAGIDWRHILVEQTRDEAPRTWWLPRAVVRLLDAAEHAETQWMQAARSRQASVAATATEPRSHPRQTPDPGSRQKTNPEPLTPALRPYTKELEGQLYSVLSRKPNTSRKVAEWACATNTATPAPPSASPATHKNAPTTCTATTSAWRTTTHTSSTPTPTPGSATGTAAPAAAHAPLSPCHTSPHGPPTPPADHCARPTAPPRAQTLRRSARVLDGQLQRARFLSAHCRRRLLPLRRAPCPGASPLPRSCRAVPCLVGRDGPCRGRRGRP